MITFKIITVIFEAQIIRCRKLQILHFRLLPLLSNFGFSISELFSPKHVVDSLKATFKKRPGNKHLYHQAMMAVMLSYMMAGMGELYCQFMYTKRLFQWKMDTYSYYNMIQVNLKPKS